MTCKKEPRTEVKQLASGYWSVWIDGNFVEAACPSKEAALAKLAQFLHNKKTK